MLGAVECGLGLASGGHVGLLVVEHEEHVLELARDGKSGVSEHEEHELELARDGKSGVSATQEPAEQADELLNRSDLEVAVEGADESVSQLELDAEDLIDLVEGKRAQRLPNPSSWRQSSSDSHQESHCWSGLWAGC